MMKLIRNDEAKLKLSYGKKVSKKSWWKRKENVFRRGSWLIHHVKVLYIFMFLKNMSLQKIYIFWYCVVDNEFSSTFSQIVEQMKNIQEVVKLGISKLDD